MTNYFTIPGYGGSGEEHWQSYFDKALPNCTRIEQKSWTRPICEDWVENIEKALSAYDPSTIVLISHSLGGIAISHWAKKYNRKIKGALIVAPPDVEFPFQPLPAPNFNPIPLAPLPFKSVVVASTNDNWCSLERANYFATHWNSELITVKEAGHINIESGHGDWPEGLALLKQFE